MIALRVLGSLELASAPIRSVRLRRLLAALATRANTVVPADWLAGVVWGGHLPVHTNAALQTLVSRLRRSIAEAPVGTSSGLRVVTQASGYLLEVAPDSLDALRFEHLVLPARTRVDDDPAEAMRLLGEALSLWRGNAYAEFAAEDFARREASRLEELRAAAVEDQIDTSLRLGGHLDVIGRLESLTAAAPLRERPHAQLMLAGYRAGRHGEALELFRAYRDRLDERLGLQPSAPMRRLQADILQQSPSLDWHPPAVRVGTARPSDDSWPRGNIVETTDHLYGREEDLAWLTAGLAPGTVTTLTGPGGVGKTRLASRAAARLSARFPGGSWLCELAAVSDGAAIASAVATCLDAPIRAGLGPTERLVAYLRDRQLLLVLDHCEHLLESSAALVHQLHRQCPGVAVLATSRSPLGIDDELVRPLAALSVPVASSSADSIASSPAVQLFLARAAGQVPNLRLDDANCADISEICRRLDGLPLALELAAPRMRTISASDLAARLSWRFPLLRGGERTATERHRTLRSVVEWSYELLDATEQHVFNVLSVFAGTFTLEVAEGLVGAAEPPEMVLDEIDVDCVLLGLVDRSMVVRVPGSVPQYAVLEAMREYGRERLPVSRLERLRRAHALQFASMAGSTASDLFGARHLNDVRVLDQHFDELRAAHGWALAHDITVAAELVGGMTVFVEHTMSAEVVEWAAQTLAAAAGTEPALSGVLAVAAAGARFRGALPEAERLVAEGLALNVQPATEAYLRYTLLAVSLLDGRMEDASRRVGELLDLADREGLSSLPRIVSLIWQLVVAKDGDPETAAAAAERIQLDAEACGETIIANWSVHVQGEALIDTDPARASALLEEALRRARDSRDRYLEEVSLVAAAMVRTRHGDPADAAPLYLAAVDHWRDSGIWTKQWITLRNVMDLLVRLYRDQPAAILLGALDSPTGWAHASAANTEQMAHADALTQRLGAGTFEVLRRQGAAMTEDEVVAVARRALAQMVSAAPG